MAFEVTTNVTANTRIQARISWGIDFDLHALTLHPSRQLQVRNMDGAWIGQGDYAKDPDLIMLDDHDRIDPETMQIYREHEWKPLEIGPTPEPTEENPTPAPGPPSAENQAILDRLQTPMQWLETVTGAQLGYTDTSWPLFGAIALFVEATAQALLAKQN